MSPPLPHLIPLLPAAPSSPIGSPRHHLRRPQSATPKGSHPAIIRPAAGRTFDAPIGASRSTLDRVPALQSVASRRLLRRWPVKLVSIPRTSAATVQLGSVRRSDRRVVAEASPPTV